MDVSKRPEDEATRLQQFIETQEARAANANNGMLQSLAGLFLHHIGFKDWETFFGDAWDEIDQLEEEGLDDG